MPAGDRSQSRRRAAERLHLGETGAGELQVALAARLGADGGRELDPFGRSLDAVEGLPGKGAAGAETDTGDAGHYRRAGGESGETALHLPAAARGTGALQWLLGGTDALDGRHRDQSLAERRTELRSRAMG